MPKKSGGFPYDATPDVHQFRGVPESCFDLVNMYGLSLIHISEPTRRS